MNFLFQAEKGFQYDGEEGNKSDKRATSLMHLESQLRKLYVDLQNVKSKMSSKLSQKPHQGTLQETKRLVNFFEMISSKQQNWEDEANRIWAEIEKYKLWLSRQGVVFDSDGSVDWKATLNVTVVYDDDLAKQGLTRVYGMGGTLYTDEKCSKLLDTSKMVTAFAGPGWGIYVMSAKGNFHVSCHSVGHRHHSSLLNGGMVAGAGELRVINGRLKAITNKSGHYAPRPIHFVQVLHQLEKMLVPMSSFQVTLMPGERQFATGQAMLDEVWSKDGVDYELNKLLAYSIHLTPEVLGPEGWVWVSTPGKQGVYDAKTNLMVLHKTVRQRLKTLGKKPGIHVRDKYGMTSVVS